MAILSEITVLLSLGGAIMGLASGADARTGMLVLRSTILNPVVAAIALGAAFGATGVALPIALDRFLAFLGGAAGPTALFAVGGALAVQHLDRTTVVAAAAIAAGKLALYPLLVWYVLTRLLPVEPFWAEAGILMAALPSAGSNYVMAQRYAADADHISAAIILSTVVSVITVPLTAWLVLR